MARRGPTYFRGARESYYREKRSRYGILGAPLHATTVAPSGTVRATWSRVRSPELGTNLADGAGESPDDPSVGGRGRRRGCSSLLPELAALGVSPGEPPFTTPAADPATWALDYSSPLGGRPGAPPPATILARYERFGFAQSEVPFLPTFPTSEDRAFVDEPRRRVLARDLGTAFAPSAGRTFALPVDEPTPQTYERLRRAAGQLGDAMPRIRLLAPEAPHPGALAAIGDVVDIWAPPLWDLYKVPEGLGAVRARGASLWWYVYGSETQRYTPNVLIDKPTTEPRLMGWLAAREGVEGFFYRALNGWDRTGAVQSPWQDPWCQSHVAEDVGCGTRVVGGNGEASLLYPGPGPHRPAYTSLRLEALRDGAEDHSLLTRLRAEDPARFARLVGGLVTPYSGRAEQGGRVGCDDNHRPAYLPVVETDPDALRSARVAMLAAFSATPLPTLRGVVRFAPGRGPEAGRPVEGARVRFGAFTTTTDARGRWRLRGVSRVPGRLTVSRDPNGRIDPVSVRITSEMLAAPRIRVVTPRMRVRPSRALVTGGGLVEWRARIGAARASRRRQTVRMTMARSYRANGDERRFDAGVAPTVTAEFERRLETRTLSEWRGYRHLEFVAEVVDPAAEPCLLIVTPDDYRNARKVAVGSRRQLVRVPLGQMRRKNAVGKLTFGIQSAVPKVWRGGHRLRATVVVKDLRLVR